MATILTVLISIISAYFIYRFLNFIRNYLEARRIGLPILLSPVSWQDPLWPLIGPQLEPLKNLPLCGWITYSSIGWTLHDRYKTHERLGPVFAIVSPRKTDIFVCDPETCKELLSSWRVWVKPPDVYRLFDIFGKNVDSVNGDDWQRHRKLAAYGFKESISHTVWEESLRQGVEICTDWSSKSEVLMSKVGRDFGIVAMNVLSASGFGKRYDFGDDAGLQKPDPGHQLSYGQALRTILDNILATVLFDSLVAPDWLLPGKLRELKLATKELRSYMQEKITEERDNLAAGAGEKANLAAVLVRANEKEKEVKDLSVRGVLTDSELLGNLFIFGVAGHETTATAFSFSLPLLAANPETQTWVAEEVDNVFGKDQEYSRAFPRLVRCMAVMVNPLSIFENGLTFPQYETLRLWGPVQALIKETLEPRTIKISGREYHVPPGTYMQCNFEACHTSPEFWGVDNMQWKPQRWVRKDKSGRELLAEAPESAAFLGWSFGPRVCPGKKFSQVEFIAVLATMLHSYRVKPAVKAGEGFDEAKGRLIGVLEDVYFTLAVKIKRPDDAALVLERR